VTLNGIALIRIMVVDDFERWRRSIHSWLQQASGLQVICEASNGLEAVQKVEALKPDLILLDINLPCVNGIDAAREICLISSKSKIIFISQESDPEVVQEAMSVGARGYVLKTDAGAELLTAVEAVVRGKTFLSRVLSHLQIHRSSTHTSHAQPWFASGESND
jgi:two-component system nitrate/nitrite response regulator NarL